MTKKEWKKIESQTLFGLKKQAAQELCKVKSIIMKGKFGKFIYWLMDKIEGFK